MIRFQCSHCGKEVEVQDAYAGSRGQCPGCGQEITVPQVGDPGGVTMSGAGAPPPAGRPVPVSDRQTAPEKTSGMAIASLVCGLLGCLQITAILAIVFGLMGIRQVNRSEGRVGGMGLAIGGMILGVFLALVGGAGVALCLSASRSLPMGLSRALEQAQRAQCAANLRSIGMSIKVYSSGNRGRWPTVYAGRAGETWGPGFDPSTGEIGDRDIDADAGDPFTCNLSCWWLLIRKGMSMQGVFICPSHDDAYEDISVDPQDWWCFENIHNCSYSYQNQLGRGTTDSADSDLVVAADASPLRADLSSISPPGRAARGKTGRWQQNSPNHNFEGQNVLYADGHIEWQLTPEVGIDGNNIWLRSTHDPSTGVWTEEPGSYSDGTSQKGNRKDSFLVP